MAFDKKLSRRDFLKIIGAGTTTVVFGSIFGGFSSLFPSNKNGRSSSSSSVGGVQQASAQSGPGTFVLGPTTGTLAMHVTNLPNGNIMYAAGSGFSSTYENGPYQWGVFNPSTGSMSDYTVNEDIFCMGQAVLPNGKVLCAGGTLRYDTSEPDGLWKGLSSAFEYDPNSSPSSLTKVQSMRHGRWYPYCIVLDDGKVLTIGGFDEWGCNNGLAEIYDPDSRSWSIKYDSTTSTTYRVGGCNPQAPAGLPTYGGANQGTMPPVTLYPRAIFMPTGLVAVAGQSATTRTWNPQTGKWTFAGNMSTARSYGNMVLLPLNNVASETGQLLVWGGSANSGANATTAVQILTPNATNNATFSFQTTTSCNFGRRHAPAAYLPDGTIVCFGGVNFQNDLSTAYYNGEIFDPVAKTWTVVGGMNLAKVYHAAGILLLDGRVWLSGDSYAKSQWELKSEYYVPSYYNATRPTISSAPSVGNYGEIITIQTPNAADIQKVSMIRLSSFTHGFNSELRFIWLQIQSKGSNSVTVSAPLNAKIAPPGWYMIHVLNSAGVPSVARVIKIPGTAGGGGGTGTYTSIYSQAGTNSYIVLNSGGFHRAGEIMTAASSLIGNSVKRVSVKLKKAGNATGPISVTFRKGAGDTVATTFGTSIDAATLTTTDQTFTLESATSQTFAANDKILVEWEGTGTSTDQVHVKRHAYTDPAASFDGINTRQAHKLATSTGYSTYNNADLAGDWFKLEGSSPGDTTAPSVAISSPANGSTVSGPSTGVTINVTGTASDNSGGSGVQKVEVKVGSNPLKLATATGPGGSGDWSTWSASDVVTTEGSTTILARATDNAGNIKEATVTVTVSFSSTYTTIYSQAGTNSYIVLNSGGYHRAGEIMTAASSLIGNSVKRVSVKLKKAGNATGPINVVVRRGTGDTVSITFGTIQADTLTTTDQTFTLESPTSHTFAANDKILVEWEGTGTSTDQVSVKRHAYTDPAASFDGINTRQAHKLATSTGYSTYNNADLAGDWSKAQ